MRIQRERVSIILALLLTTPTMAADLATVPVRVMNGGDSYVAEGLVEAVHQSVIAAQVPGRITELAVKAGDRVKKGQVLARIDNQAAVQQAGASAAQVASANAQLNVARKEFERQQALFKKNYLSQAALDQAEAQFKATEAAVRGAIAQAGAANTQTGFYTLVAPYDGVVAEVPAAAGDMAMPGKPLVTVYEPGEMRVVASLPQGRVVELPADAAVRVEIPALAKETRWQTSTTVTVLPTADAGSQSVRVRLGLPSALPVVPGMFARAAFPLKGSGDARLLVPARAVVRRTELTAVYVLPPKGAAQLRQVRLGKTQGDEIEVLSGVRGGELVAVDPVAAAR